MDLTPENLWVTTYSKNALPEGFTPSFKKQYETHGCKFEVQIQNKGIRQYASGPRDTWDYALYVGKCLVTTGAYSWDPKRRILNDEKVCNHLASYWGPSELVKKAQGFIDPMDEIVEKCAQFMREYFMLTSVIDYDILQSQMDPDNSENWEVILNPSPAFMNDERNVILMFQHRADKEFIVFTCHELIAQHEILI